MATNIEVKAKPGENTGSILRRFSQTVRRSNLVGRVKGISYRERPLSDFEKKKSKLRRIEKSKHYEKLYKLGKLGGSRRRR